MDKKILKQINKLPLLPGVYLFKDRKGKILYIGKAAKLKLRVKSYFNKPLSDLRLNQMVTKITQIKHILCDSEIEALILESEFICRYKPKYNIEWKDDKNFLYIMITKEEIPRVSEIRPPLLEKAIYLGPFTDAQAVRNTLKNIRRIFPYRSCKNLPQKACLQYYIKRCPAPCTGSISLTDYKKTIKNLVNVLSGKKEKIILEIEKAMKIKAREKKFEEAAELRDRLFDLKKIRQTVIFDETKKDNLEVDESLINLAKVLILPQIPRRIEAYDISNISGHQATGSMIVFESGLPAKKEYKKFKIKKIKGINDCKMMKEILERRFKNNWQIPDLIIIDGGKGQLNSALEAIKKANLKMPINIIGLAKKKEEIIIKKGHNFHIINLPNSSKVLHLLQRIRDEAHRFAIIYHTKLKEKKIRNSEIDEIFGIGGKTKKLLLKKFGSIKNIKKSKDKDIIKLIGKNKTNLLRKKL